MLDETENEPSIQGERYCSIQCCKNSQGSLDQNTIFFRTPDKGTELRDDWIKMLSFSADANLSFECFDYLCQLHFKSEDIDTEMHDNEATYKLKTDALPLPIEIDTMEDTKFIDMNQFLNISCDADIKLEPLSDGENYESLMETPLDSNGCTKCIQYDMRLKKANLKVKMLQNQVETLKMEIHRLKAPANRVLRKVVKVPRIHPKSEQTSSQALLQKCKLCYKKLSTNEIYQHLCLEDQQYIMCPYCAVAFDNTNALLNHIGVHRMALKIDRKHKFFECDKCPIAYVMNVLLRCHKMAHVKGNTADGIPVDKDFESIAIVKLKKPDNFNQIIGKVIAPSLKPAPPKPSIKTVCAPVPTPVTVNASIDPKDALLKPFKCAKCQEPFETGSQLRYHVLLHRTDTVPVNAPTNNEVEPVKKFKMPAHKPDSQVIMCEECGKTFTKAKHLKEHKLSSAHAEPSFGCQDYGKKYYFKKNWRRHKCIKSKNKKTK